MMNTYSTNQIVGIIVVHSNTVRMHEECGLIHKPK